MASYVIQDTTLTGIADAIREKNAGKTITNEIIIGTDTSSSPNATGFNSYNGAYANNLSITDTVTIPGATKIKVKIAYQTESISYDYVTITPGVGNAIEKLGNSTRQEREYEFPGTDTVSFYFKSDSSNGDYLGYYAEITGYGEEEIDLSTVTYKPNEMAAAISNIEAGGKVEAPLAPVRSDATFKPTRVSAYTTSGQVYYGPAENNYYKKYYWYRNANDNIYWEICAFNKGSFTTGRKYRFSTWIWHDNGANDNEEIEIWQNTIFFNSATSAACPLKKITKDPQLLQVEVDWTSSNDVYGAVFYLYPAASNNQVRLMPIIVEDLTSPSNNVPMPV